jgi:hypothetical protein
VAIGLEVPPELKRIYDWNRHTWIEVAAYSANSLGCYQSVPKSLRPYRRRGPLTLRQRIRRYLRRYGPQTTRRLAEVLLLSGEMGNVSRIIQQLNSYPEAFIVVGHVQTKGGKKKLWGVNNGDKKLCGTDGTEGDRGIGYDGLGEKSRKQEPAQRDEETPLADVPR